MSVPALSGAKGPGATNITNWSWVQEPCLTAARLADGHSDRQAGRKSKNCDEQLTHIVRVMQSYFFILNTIYSVESGFPGEILSSL